MLSHSAQASAKDRRAGPLRSYAAVPAPALRLPAFARKPWIWFTVLAVSTVVSGSALAVSSRAPARAMPLLMSRNELARRPIGEYIAVPCDHVQSSDHGQLRRVTLCVVGQHILAVAGGNRIHDGGGLLQGYAEELPGEPGPSWASALRRQIEADPRYYNFYLRRESYGDDTPDDGEEAGRSDDASRSAVRPDHHSDGGHTYEAVIRGLAVAASLATLAGWFVWLRLWQHRRRVAAWILPE